VKDFNDLVRRPDAPFAPDDIKLPIYDVESFELLNIEEQEAIILEWQYYEQGCRRLQWEALHATVRLVNAQRARLQHLSKTSSFTRFSHLPTELQDKIWYEIMVSYFAPSGELHEVLQAFILSIKLLLIQEFSPLHQTLRFDNC